jgi:hypothetical protein
MAYLRIEFYHQQAAPWEVASPPPYNSQSPGNLCTSLDDLTSMWRQRTRGQTCVVSQRCKTHLLAVAGDLAM